MRVKEKANRKKKFVLRMKNKNETKFLNSKARKEKKRKHCLHSYGEHSTRNTVSTQTINTI